MPEWLPALVPVLGRALVDFVWQGAAIGLLVALLLLVLRDARPQARYAVACLGLLACVVVPLANVVAGWSALADMHVATAPRHVASGTDATTGTSFVRWPGDIEAALPLLVSLWAAGASTCFLRLACGVAWVRRLRRDGRVDPAWQVRLDAIAQRLRLRRAVVLRLVDGIASPVAAGWWRPMVLLPAALAARMPVGLLEALLAHELAHVRRHDYLVNLLQGVAEALLFYHPVTWWLSRRIRIEREHVADALAAEAVGDPRRLAVALAELADTASRPACTPPTFTPHLAPAAHGGLLMSRIARLVTPARRSTNGRLAFPLLGLAAAGIAFIAHAQIGDRPAERKAAAPTKPTATLPAHAANASKEPGVLRLTRERRDDAYAVVREGSDSMTMSGSIDDIDGIRAVQRVVDRDFVWFRRDGREFVITDPATIARARAAWRESERLGAQMEALGKRMEPHQQKMEALGERMERLGEHQQETEAMERASDAMEALGERMAELGERQRQAAADMLEDDEHDARHEATMRELAREMAALSAQMAPHQKMLEAESARLATLQAPMQALSREMEAASKPMEALGKEMEALGRQHEKLAEQAERELQALLRDAQAKGLAQPAPQAGPAQ